MKKQFLLLVVCFVTTLFSIGSFGQTNKLDSTGNVGIGTTSPATLLHLHQAAGSSPTFRMSDGDVNHGITLFGISANTIYNQSPYSGNDGGNLNWGLSQAAGIPALTSWGIIGNTSPTVSPVIFSSGKKNGSGVQALASTEKAFSFYNSTANDVLGNELLTILGGGKVGIGTTTPSSLLDITINDASTNSVTSGLTITHNTSGTSAVGFGSSIDFKLEKSDGTLVTANRIISSWNNISAPYGKMTMYNHYAGSEVEVATCTTTPVTGLPGSFIVYSGSGNQGGYIGFGSNGNGNQYGTVDVGAGGSVFLGNWPALYRSGNNAVLSGYNGISFGNTSASNRIDMTLDNSGNLGIGTVSPSAQLHTTGSVRFGGLSNDNTFSRVVVTDANGNLSYRDASTIGGSAGWSYDGNTVGVLKKIGTTDNYDLPIITNNTEWMRITTAGNIGIGTTSPSEKLAVNGNIVSKKVKVTQTGWADYVFQPSYQLPSLNEVEAYIQQHQHLPGVPSAKEVEKNGIDLGDNQAALLKKIEELTLYVIEIKKENEEMRKEIKQLQKRK